MTALQTIIKEAKAIRKKMPKIEWKKAVAQASAIYASKHKGKSPVGKKKAVKKAAKKKAVGKYVKTVKKGKITNVVYKRKKIGAVKKSATTMHKDTKSHNVNIRVMSGLNSKIIQRLKDITNEIEQREDVIASVMNRKKDLIAQHGKAWYTKWIKDAKGIVAECKKHKSELKRFI